MSARWCAVIAAAIAILLTSAAVLAQRQAAPRLPPVSMTCPMHPDVVESRPGSCPLCKMNLVPVRLDSTWMCPLHSRTMRDEAGTCPICGRQLVQVRVSLTWTCLAQPGIERLEPGTCPDGTPMVVRRTLRPHGNHNPQHGGQFFMAPDNWHHLEGTYPQGRRFRLYVYDDYARPLSAGDLRRVQGRVVTRETFDPQTKKTSELAVFPLRVSRDGGYLEAQVDAAALPREMTAKLRIKPDGPEYRFDFTFPALTREPARAAPAAPPARSLPRPPTAAAVPVPAPAAAAAPAPEDAALAPLDIPGSVPEILAALQLRDQRIREFIKQGNFGAVWVPAFHAKDLAIALEPHTGHLSPAGRQRGEPALQEVVRLAWLLDAFGDVGNRQQVEAAYAAFSAAVSEVASVFAEAQ